MIFRSENVSDSISKVCPVSAAILSQCLAFMALLAISSSRGQLSLKSSMVFLRSKNACQSFRARGSLRHLGEKNANIDSCMHTCINISYYLTHAQWVPISFMRNGSQSPASTMGPNPRQHNGSQSPAFEWVPIFFIRNGSIPRMRNGSQSPAQSQSPAMGLHTKSLATSPSAMAFTVPIWVQTHLFWKSTNSWLIFSMFTSCHRIS